MNSPRSETSRLRVINTPQNYAVLLNGRAKGWSGAVHQAVQRYVPPRDLFLTDDFRQAERSVDRLLTMDYDMIFTGGGDGTIIYLVNAIEERVRDGRLTRETAPPIGVLRLGTGNAIAHYLGAGDIIDDLRSLRSGRPINLHQVSMVESRGELFPFAGFGWDADILNDYSIVKDSSRNTALEPYATGLGGYVAATISRTVPRALRQGAAEIVATNLGERAYSVSEEGEVLEEFGFDEVMYRGPAKVAGVGSVPFWGFKIKMFPHVELFENMVEFRAFDGRPSDVLLHLPSWWQGRFRSGRIVNLMIEKMRLEILTEPLAYQVAGDAAGFERVVEWSCSPEPIQLAVPLP